MPVEIEHAGLGAAYLRSHPDVPIAHVSGAPCAWCGVKEQDRDAAVARVVAILVDPPGNATTTAEAIVTSLRAPGAASPEAPNAGPWSFEGLTGDGWAIIGPGDAERHFDWSADGYGRAIALDREDAERIVNALNGATSPEPVDGLGEAWAAAKAVLPPGWTFEVAEYPDEYIEQLGKAHAEAWDVDGGVSKGHARADGETPTAALQALAARLSGDPSEERTVRAARLSVALRESGHEELAKEAEDGQYAPPFNELVRYLHNIGTPPALLMVGRIMDGEFDGGLHRSAATSPEPVDVERALDEALFALGGMTFRVDALRGAAKPLLAYGASPPEYPGLVLVPKPDLDALREAMDPARLSGDPSEERTVT